jgi:DNA repair exonuclease SbcCD nuclease subunit
VEPVRFVHAADLHLDAPFKGVDAADARVSAELVASTYRALDAIVEVCLARTVDFLVIAGDVYNSAEKRPRAEFAFRRACERLGDAGIRVFVARGNHDPASGWSAGLVMPETVHVFSEREVERVPVVRTGEEVCAVYGRSFRTAAETANLAREFARAKADRLAVGVLHTNVGGRTDYEPYAPCSLDDLRAAKMDYWALGHIHKPEVLSEAPPVVYAGCPQGLDPNETGPRGVRVVTLDERGATTEFVPTAAVVWERAAIDAGEIDSLDALREAVLVASDDARRSAADRPVVLRVEIGGRSAVHADLARPGVLRDLVAEVRADALERDPWVWIDRLADATRPLTDLEALRESQDFAGDLVRLSDALLADEAARDAFVAELAQPVLAMLDTRDAPAIDAASVLERARDLALDRLLAEEDR